MSDPVGGRRRITVRTRKNSALLVVDHETWRIDLQETRENLLVQIFIENNTAFSSNAWYWQTHAAGGEYCSTIAYLMQEEIVKEIYRD